MSNRSTGDADSLDVRQATETDLSELVRVHKVAYPASHFTTLLPSGTLEAYYRCFLTDGSSIFVATSRQSAQEQAHPEGGKIDGFAVFGERIPEKIAAFKRAYALSILGVALKHPATATGKVLRRVTASSQSSRGVTPSPFLLLSIAVSKPRRGIGSKLLSLVKSAACASGHEVVGLYVNTDNIAAINAYFGSGFTLKSATSTQYYMESACK